jgi:hypothetical protein
MLVPAALLALPLTGCEIALIVAAAADDDGETYPDYDDEYYETYCNDYVDTNSALGGDEGKAKLFNSTFVGVSSPTPGKLLASNDMFPFFLTTEEDPNVTFRVDATGVLSRVDESVGACSTYEYKAGSFLEVETAGPGNGSLVVFVDDEEYDRFDFEVADVKDLSIKWDTSLSAARATLVDDEGRSVYAYNAITWEAAPTAIFTATAGPISPTISWDGVTSEVVLFAFYGELSAQMTLVANQSTGTMTPKDE